MTNTAIVSVDQARAEGMLGASDAPAALGMSKYKSPLTLWKQLRGEPYEDNTPAEVREAAEWGQLHEPIIRGRYAIQRRMLVQVPDRSVILAGWLRATPDGYVSSTPLDAGWTQAHDAEGVPELAEGLLQVKTRSAFQRDAWEHGVPPAEEIQCRVEMAVTGLPWNDCAVLLGGNKMLVHRIERDAKLEENILAGLGDFWDRVKSGHEPDVDGSAAWRAEVSARMTARASKVVIQPDDELRELCAYAIAQRSKAAKAEEELDAAKNDLLLRLSAAGATRIQLNATSKITAYRTGSKTDWKAAYIEATGQKECPDKFKREGTTWALRFPGGDED